MKTHLLVPAFFLAAIAAPVMAQDTPAPPPQTMPPAADPNAGQPTGQVPPAASNMVPANPTTPTDPSAPVGSSANPAVVGGNMDAPPATPKDYPKCTATITDECVSSGAGHHSHKKR